MLHLGVIDVKGLWEWRQVSYLCELKSPFTNHFFLSLLA